jgi:hypothetical protein
MFLIERGMIEIFCRIAPHADPLHHGTGAKVGLGSKGHYCGQTRCSERMGYAFLAPINSAQAWLSSQRHSIAGGASFRDCFVIDANSCHNCATP